MATTTIKNAASWVVNNPFTIMKVAVVAVVGYAIISFVLEHWKTIGLLGLLTTLAGAFPFLAELAAALLGGGATAIGLITKYRNQKKAEKKNAEDTTDESDPSVERKANAADAIKSENLGDNIDTVLQDTAGEGRTLRVNWRDGVSGDFGADEVENDDVGEGIEERGPVEGSTVFGE